ncbi:MAG: GGDEF domain-containing protein [Thermoguttaceae bacterium]
MRDAGPMPNGQLLPELLFLILIPLATGVLLGRLLFSTRPPQSHASQTRNTQQARRFFARLLGLVARVTGDVGRHRSQMEQLNRQLASARSHEDQPPAACVLKAIADILRINQRLQDRLHAAEQKLQEQARQLQLRMSEARTDPLTGLPNRRAFQDALARRFAEWRRKNTVFCLMMADLDNFKSINDRHGHAAGDSVLRGVAEMLENVLREMDFVARIGGEEFAVILPSTGALEGCRTAELCRSALAGHPFRREGLELRLTVSLGLAAVEAADDAASLLRRADEALYAAKRAGRNRAFFHNGRDCQPLPRPDQPAESPSAEPSGGDDEDAWASLCDDLRAQLARLTEQTE